MFRSFIYLNEDKMYSYLRLIDEKYATRVIEKSTEKRRGANLGIAALALNTEVETKEQRSFLADSSRDYDAFEKALKKLDGSEFFDLVLDSDYDIKLVPQMSIIRLYGTLDIPEQFDMYSIAPKMMDYIARKVEVKNDDEKAILETFLKDASADIPVLIEGYDIAISGKLNLNALLEEYSQLEEYCEQEVYLLCKVVGVVNKPQVEVFNPLKDFIKIPRAARRNMSFSNDRGMESIIVDGPVLKVEIISIYK